MTVMNNGLSSGRQGRSFLERVVGAAGLRADIYEEVAADTSATPAAAFVIIVSSIAGGIGALGTTGIVGLVVGIVVALGGWVVWAYSTYVIGTRLLPTPETKADWGELSRTLGFARAPVVLVALAFLPGLSTFGGWIVLVVFVWSIAAMVVAVRCALDYESTGRAMWVVFLGFVPYSVFSLVTLRITTTIIGEETVGLTL